MNTHIENTATIAVGYLKGNELPASEIPELLKTIHAGLLATERPAQAPRPEPACDPKKSVKHDHIVCLDCGRKSKMLRGHIRAQHGLSPEEYRERWGLPRDYPLTAPAFAEVRSQIAKTNGLGTSPKAGRGRRAA